jgi:F-type H+-transporting ATPase subunit delta
MNDSKISVRYAKALFELALEKNELSKVHEDIVLLSEVLNDNVFSNFLKSPIVQNSKKIEIVSNALKNKLTSYVFDFLVLVIQNNREESLKLIFIDFLKHYRDTIGVAEVELTTAIEIDNVTKEKIVSLLRKLLSKEIELKTSIKPELIGGFVARIDDLQLDASIKSKLNSIRKELNKPINETN